METGLNGKVALVTAGSAGIGLAVARGLLDEGCKVAICGRDRSRLDRAVDSLKATPERLIAVPADVSRPDDTDRLMATVSNAFGRVDVLVNNNGGPPPGMFTDLDDAAWEAAFELVHMSAVRLTRAVLPGMRQAGSGRIINISSYSVKQVINGLMLSNSIRLGLIGWAKTLADEVAADGILVNTVCPGWTSTDRITAVVNKQAANAGKSADATLDAIKASIPMRRLAEPSEIADLVVFLASKRASYITGTAIHVDGGLVRGPF